MMMTRKRDRGLACAAMLLAMALPPVVNGGDTPVLLPPSTQAGKPGAPSRVGTVALVREIKERGLTAQNWTGVVGSLFTFDTEKDVTRVLYEVTIFFADGSQGEVVLDRDPGLRAGQRVRVTGTRIEALEP